VSAFVDYLERVRPAIDEALSGYLAVAESPLGEWMRYAVLDGGKRVRPALVLAAAEACGGSIDQALPAACAAEFVHAYSLVHDDLPAMDDDEERRGRPTVHVEFGEAAAVLAGDALLTLAFEALSRGGAGAGVAPEVIVGQVADLAHAAGPAGMVLGQSEDLAARGREVDAGTLSAVEMRKTGYLLAACARMGGRSAGASGDVLATLHDYGLGLGLAYQLADDLLDVGKDESDEAMFPTLIGEERTRELAGEARDKARGVALSLGPGGEVLASLADFAVEREG